MVVDGSSSERVQQQADRSAVLLSSIELEIDGNMVRIGPDASANTIVTVLRALNAGARSVQRVRKGYGRDQTCRLGSSWAANSLNTMGVIPAEARAPQHGEGLMQRDFAWHYPDETSRRAA